jgi:hypothetical protein
MSGAGTHSTELEREGTKMKQRDTKRRWRPGLLLALALALGALVLAGCGGSSGGSSSSGSSTTASAAGSEGSGSESSGAEGEKGGPGAMNISEEAKACLKEKGIELPEFKGGEGGPPSGGLPEGGEKPEGGPPAGGFGGQSEEMQKTFEECGVETPEFKGGPGGEGAPDTNSAAFKKQVKEYAACVRENGYELAQPNFSGEGPVFEKSESESAGFKKASASCEGLLGAPEGEAENSAA